MPLQFLLGQYLLTGSLVYLGELKTLNSPYISKSHKAEEYIDMKGK